MNQTKKIYSVLTLVIVVFLSSVFLSLVNAQSKAPDMIAERFFMPAIQMGYINHNSEKISSGLMIQTSIEYRTKHGLLFRINYDDFSGRLNLIFSGNQSYIARISISELIGGIGYRITRNRGNFFLVLQPGIRFYENPFIQSFNGNINIEQKGSTIGTMRYTIGYEYEIFENIFLNSEIFTGHFFIEKDYWSNKKPYLGVTLGVAARLF